TYCSGGNRSIQLSYGRVLSKFTCRVAVPAIGSPEKRKGGAHFCSRLVEKRSARIPLTNDYQRPPPPPPRPPRSPPRPLPPPPPPPAAPRSALGRASFTLRVRPPA